MPNDAVFDLLSFPRPAGFAEVVVLSGRVDFPDPSTAEASLHWVIIADIPCRGQHCDHEGTWEQVRLVAHAVAVPLGIEQTPRVHAVCGFVLCLLLQNQVRVRLRFPMRLL